MARGSVKAALQEPAAVTLMSCTQQVSRTSEGEVALNRRALLLEGMADPLGREHRREYDLWFTTVNRAGRPNSVPLAQPHLRAASAR